LFGQQFHQALGGAGRAQQVAKHFGQCGGRTGHQTDVEHRLSQNAGAHAAFHDRHRAQIQAIEQGAEHGDDDEGGEQRAHLVAADRSAKGGFGRAGKPPGFVFFAGVALHYRHGGEHFGGQRAGVGDAVLAGAR